jgi:GT2 family glycosyltransferase
VSIGAGASSVRNLPAAVEALALPMTYLENNTLLTADVVIPVHGERPEALAATLSACLKQTYPISTVFVVDDGSTEPIQLPDWAQSLPHICLLRLPQNLGISAARNAAIACSNAPFLACINTQVLPDPDWLATCLNYLSNHLGVGACYARLVSYSPHRILTRWRMRFLETRFGEQSGPTPFAPGHAVLFRKEALDLVGGYDVRYRRHHEDSDICQRMRISGWETHYIAESRCISLQEDTLKQLAAKELRESYWYSPAESSLVHVYMHLSKWTLIRAGRNILKGRFYFIPVDVAIWASALWTATIRTLRFSQASGDLTSTTPVGMAPPSDGARVPSEIPKKL